jgi:hypothetical protein
VSQISCGQQKGNTVVGSAVSGSDFDRRQMVSVAQLQQNPAGVVLGTVAGSQLIVVVMRAHKHFGVIHPVSSDLDQLSLERTDQVDINRLPEEALDLMSEVHEHRRPPVVITDDGEPVAVIKPLSDAEVAQVASPSLDGASTPSVDSGFSLRRHPRWKQLGLVAGAVVGGGFPPAPAVNPTHTSPL